MAKFSMKDVMELANQIKDKRLKEKVLKLFKELTPSNQEIVYPSADFSRIPAWAVGAHHSYEGGELDHTVSLCRLSLALADHFESVYGIKPNRDHLIAGCLLHDIAKIWIIRRDGKNWGFTGASLDHADFSAAELYARGFPEEVVHIVAAHGGDMGAGAAAPRTIEAVLVVRADVLDAEIESHIHPAAPQLPIQLVLLSEGKSDEK